MKTITTLEEFVGDDWNIPLTLGKVDENGVFTPISISLSATIQTSLISKSGTILIVATNQLNSSPNADWANGVVAVVFDNTLTSSLTPNVQAFIEIEIDESGLKSTYQTEPDILIKKAYIT